VNAVEVAAARLVQSGIVRVSRSGELSATSSAQPTGHALDDAVLGELTGPRMVTAVMRRKTVERAVTEVGESLVRRGLLVPPAKSVLARWLGPVVLYIVFVVGVVRWVNGVANDLPVGYLSVLLVVTAMALMLLTTRSVFTLKARTVHGDHAVAAVRTKGSEADPLERVAVSGPRAHPDKDVSYALSRASAAAIVPTTWSYASGGSFDSYFATASSSGSSGGGYSASTVSSCGGSSGGGGGCGGGSSS
jgi:uncharacterized protein (TIGR04222 family)